MIIELSFPEETLVVVDLKSYKYYKGSFMPDAPSDLDYYGHAEMSYKILENEEGWGEDAIENAIIEYMEE